MTPEEFYEKAKQIYDKNEGYAGESGHMDADRLMEECLISLGYEKGIDVLMSMSNFWYA